MNTSERCSSAAGSPESSARSSLGLTDDQLLDRLWAGSHNHKGGAGAAIPANNADSPPKPPRRLHVRQVPILMSMGSFPLLTDDGMGQVAIPI
jgi:hypothetical protein